MTTNEDVELLKALMAIALADGELRRSELGVIKGLASRIGVGRVTFDAMFAAAEAGEPIADNILIRSPERARSALELLVAEARIDGEISDRERDLLVRIATSLGLTGDDFQAVYQAGIKHADKIRRSHQGHSLPG